MTMINPDAGRPCSTRLVTEAQKEWDRPAAPPLGTGPRRTTSLAAATADTTGASSPECIERTAAEKAGEELEAARAEHRRLLDALDGRGGNAPEGHRPKLRRAARRAAERAARLEGVLERLRKQGD
ncbi:MAG: hypothetical protein ICV73_06610 [Acetobacteraceae bacterium]|nr:hypothetical protein [Acetobacteraceae bacterium]